MVSLVRLHAVLDCVTDPGAGALLSLTLPKVATTAAYRLASAEFAQAVTVQ